MKNTRKQETEKEMRERKYGYYLYTYEATISDYHSIYQNFSATKMTMTAILTAWTLFAYDLVNQ